MTLNHIDLPLQNKGRIFGQTVQRTTAEPSTCHFMIVESIAPGQTEN